MGGPDAKNAIFAAYRSGQVPFAFDCLRHQPKIACERLFPTPEVGNQG